MWRNWFIKSGLARRLADPGTLVRVINDCSAALRIPSTLGENLADGLEALGVAEGLGDPVGLYWAATHAHVDANRSGQFELGSRCQATAKDVSDRLQQPALLWHATYTASAVAMLHGDPLKAEELATQALEVGTNCGQPDAFSTYGTQLTVVRYQQGRTGELAPLIFGLVEQNPGVPGYQGALAQAYLDGGDVDAARRLVEEGASTGFAAPLTISWIHGILGFARPAVELNLPGPAEQGFDLLSAYHDQVPYETVLALDPVAMYLGGLSTVLGRYELAGAYFEEATDLIARGAMRFAAAYTQLLWARMLIARRRAGDSRRARDLLEQTLTTATDCGYAVLEHQSAALLKRPRGNP
jgi:tetratricopeptide (TPR) repeat protein